MRRILPLLLIGAALAAACEQKPTEVGAPPSDAKAVEKGFPTPDDPAARQRAPDVFRVRFTTSKGDFVIEARRAWAPIGTDRFYNLVRLGWYDDVRIFRVDPRFVVQFGMSGDPERSKEWMDANIPDDPVTQKNVKGSVSFATAGPGTRTTQIFVNVVNNSSSLDHRGFAPFGTVVEGLDVLTSLTSTKPEHHPQGRSPQQHQIAALGNQYLDSAFPELTRIESAKVEK